MNNIEIFHEDSVASLERNINSYITGLPDNLKVVTISYHPIYYCTGENGNFNTYFSALVITDNKTIRR